MKINTNQPPNLKNIKKQKTVKAEQTEIKDRVDIGKGEKAKTNNLATILMSLPVPTVHKYLTDEQMKEMKSSLQPGDVVLRSCASYPGWKVGVKVAMNSDWIHAGYYVGDGMVIDSTTERGVGKVSIEDFACGQFFKATRPKYKTEEDKELALKKAESLIGRPYDFDWKMGDDEIYCTELVYESLKACKNPLNMGKMEEYKGKKMISHNSYINSPDFEPVWAKEASFAESMAGHLPYLAVYTGLGLGLGYTASALGAGPVAATLIGVGGSLALWGKQAYYLYHNE